MYFCTFVIAVLGGLKKKWCAFFALVWDFTVYSQVFNSVISPSSTSVTSSIESNSCILEGS